MPEDGVARLRERVNTDPRLAAKLRACPAECFSDMVLAAAAELQIDVGAGDLARALAAGRSAWMLRWIR